MKCLPLYILTILSLNASAQSGRLLSKADSISVAGFIPHTISPDYYKKQLGFFCLKELQVEKALKVPLKFRLGGLDYCNYLEGKNRGYRR